MEKIESTPVHNFVCNLSKVSNFIDNKSISEVRAVMLSVIPSANKSVFSWGDPDDEISFKIWFYNFMIKVACPSSLGFSIEDSMEMTWTYILRTIKLLQHKC